MEEVFPVYSFYEQIDKLCRSKSTKNFFTCLTHKFKLWDKFIDGLVLDNWRINFGLVEPTEPLIVTKLKDIDINVSMPDKEDYLPNILLMQNVDEDELKEDNFNPVGLIPLSVTNKGIYPSAMLSEGVTDASAFSLKKFK